MKNLKLNLGALALLLGVTAAAAGAPSRQNADHKWGIRANGEYVDVTGLGQPSGYQCTGQENVCTELYPEGVNPNDQENDSFPGIAEPSESVPGDFTN